jgi:hypothetical protein
MRAVEWFLSDYLNDRRLLRRLNQVMRRVPLPQLPDATTDWFREVRARTYEQAPTLLWDVSEI